ncbi:SDR family NAD(P)-dependent oxidoreductase [Rhodococcus sp. CSLK01-03]|uniref:3-oxoacyl-[acyl-carrier-protein] reductase MabA n=1 Tax=Rhodococcus indonesiensis TaxID=3055869 RepID=A0ABT7RUJ9_9NOCA|nr:SDR family NAD(P)-dependent oxidoreductase [Rhodococcus indonesiensis]MDM7490889.1 SDR family NAD(P)-dependent oxidoreductase [Rhodococcus indonesiensis]
MVQRTALVTGASGGIGVHVVERLRRDGFEVITSDVVGDVDLRLDVVNDPLPSEVFDQVDVIVSNAATVDTIAPTESISREKWQRDVDVNLTGAFRVIQACLRGMRERRYGRIIGISSVASTSGLSGKIAYAASKAGLNAAVKTIAIETAEQGITANCVLPGFVNTPGLRALPRSAFEHLLSAMPTGRFCEPAEVADVIGFLAAESSAYITGQEITIDGGLSLHRLSMLGGQVGTNK